jgi:23S rRNA (adenine1618-N6)-methyltransferase
MVGRKVNLKFLTSKLREVGVTIVKTTEFVQGQTCRWGLAWSFVPPVRKIISPLVQKNSLSFTLEVWICPSQFNSLVNLSLKLFIHYSNYT